MSRHGAKFILLFGGVQTSASGGASGDTTPSAFSWTDQTDAVASTQYFSNTVTLAGFDTPVAISISGGDGQYSKNGGAYTSSAGTAVPGDTIRLRATSSGTEAGVVNIVFTAGGVSDTYTVTTHADSVPTLTQPTLALDPSSDTGSSSSDKITYVTSLNLIATFPDGILENGVIRYKVDGAVVATHTVTAGEAGGSPLPLGAPDLTPGATYALQINYTAPNGTDFTAYSTAINVAIDTAPPTISSSSPSDGATNATVGQNITVTFNENVAFGTGNVTIKKTSDDSTIEAFDVVTEVGTGNGQISISGAVMTINPTASMVETVGYYLLIDATAIDDIAGNSFAGISSKTTLNWTVADITAPSAPTLSPADNATSVAIGANMTATFVESIQFGATVSITIKKTSDNSTVFAYTASDIGSAISISGAVLTINPASDLTASTEYYVQISSGSIEDLAGNPFAGITSTTAWSFTTASASAVTFSAASKVVTPTTGGASSISWPLALAADDTALAVGVFWFSTSTTITSVTVGPGPTSLGAAKVASNISGGGGTTCAAIYGLTDLVGLGLAGTTVTITVNFSGNNYAAGFATSVKGSDLTTVFSNVRATGGGTGIAGDNPTDTCTSAAGEVVVDVCGGFATQSGTISGAGTGFTPPQQVDNTHDWNGNLLAGSSHYTATGSSVGTAWTLNIDTSSNICMASFKKP